MAKIFISYSSKDQEFVRELAADLGLLGHAVWLDEWQLRVGDCVVTKVQEGLSQSEYVVLVLSSHAVKSGWVDREWKAKYWAEIQTQKKFILPVLLEDCTVPPLLATRQYADFRVNRRFGLAKLALAITPTVTGQSIEFLGPAHEPAEQVSALLAKIYSAAQPLSQSLAEALTLARQLGEKDLQRFCEQELTGYDKDSSPAWRSVEVYVSATARLNPQYIGYSDNISAALDDMAADREHFRPARICIMYPVADLERRPSLDPHKSLLTVNLTVGRFVQDAANPSAPVTGYMRADALVSILTAIKVEVTKRLLKLLPAS